MRKKVRVKEIASRAGVSVTTVLNVIHGRTERMSTETKQKIEKILKEEDYLLNVRARVLAGRGTKLYVILDGTTNGRPTQRSRNYEYLKQIEQYIFNKNQYALIHFANGIEEGTIFTREWKADGVVMIGFPKERMPLFEEETGCQSVWVSERESEEVLHMKLETMMYELGRIS